MTVYEILNFLSKILEKWGFSKKLMHKCAICESLIFGVLCFEIWSCDKLRNFLKNVILKNFKREKLSKNYERFILEEIIFMVIEYGKTENYMEVQRRWTTKFPTRPQPSHQAIVRICDKFQEIGSVAHNRAKPTINKKFR